MTDNASGAPALQPESSAQQPAAVEATQPTKPVAAEPQVQPAETQVSQPAQPAPVAQPAQQKVAAAMGTLLNAVGTAATNAATTAANTTAATSGQAQPTGTPAVTQPQVTIDEKIWGALAYIPMVALLALLVKPESAYIKLHGRQGLMLFIIFFLSLFLYVIFSPLGPLVAGLLQLGLFVVGVYSLYQAFIGNWWKIPVLGDIAEKIPVSLFTKVVTEAVTGQIPAGKSENDTGSSTPSTPKS